MTRVRTLRTFLGNMAGPWTGWLLMRSLETLKVRMEAQALGAKVVANFLVNHPKVERVYYLGFITHELFSDTHTLSPGGAIIGQAIFNDESIHFHFRSEIASQGKDPSPLS